MSVYIPILFHSQNHMHTLVLLACCVIQPQTTNKCIHENHETPSVQDMYIEIIPDL